ncbi:glucosaminidase domain-containing protein [Vagococcus xieshaowenii]|uniref:Peptidoglycan hydrolase n=1 Tax=Vagococcus xieshaowenii TaxID=2562451 RepID=A0ABX5TFT7_9ENTE|nr:glucosaminidase domain-containing protein [Vagococcus xieshaowenii]QCA29467.1 LysM peptidoglycan-binding domain-containing protein [Vagococcus xieshaowenii]
MKQALKTALMVTPFVATTTLISADAEEIAAIGEEIHESNLTTRKGNTQTFIDSIASQAQAVAAANDLYASVMIAQACLETGYGTSSLSQAPNYNLFGIKGAYNGRYVTMQTWEDDGKGNAYWIDANFRKYPSFKEAFNDNAHVLKTTSFSSGHYYYAGAWKSQTTSYKEATAWLTGRYATDTGYGGKLNAIIETYQLSQYDSPGNETGGGTTENNTNLSTEDKKHTVVSGDTLYAIAKQHHTTVAAIKTWNKLKTDTIYIGQTLLVSAKKNARN